MDGVIVDIWIRRGRGRSIQGEEVIAEQEIE